MIATGPEFGLFYSAFGLPSACSQYRFHCFRPEADILRGGRPSAVACVSFTEIAYTYIAIYFVCVYVGRSITQRLRF
jgi:hypothetical protein